MKTPLRTLLASALLCAPVFATAAPALTPEQTLDLYARVLIEDDAAAARTLNDALRSAHDGNDAVTPTPGALAKALAEPWMALQASVGGKVDAAATEALYARVLKASACRATGSTIEDNEYVDDQKIATVDFTCQVANLDSVRPLFAASMTSDEPASRTRFIEAYTQALERGTQRTVKGSQTLYSGADQAYWFSGSFDALVTPVLEALAPFQVWMEEAEAASAPKVTGVPGCDLLLQQHRSCVAKIAPEQISGVDAMAEELKAKAQVLSADEMTQECKALRPIAQMMWTEECV
ncbi:hypothetical protein C1924_03105 [Stenotrophomonas sp. ESTM1D_MKCIP4_1]|uniref:hypothetical protein n=1 Tax=Stenotrophomonas sp. ESTM1D_MKCIP4_1 TaxID=2072414 RepID=UPI000D53D7A2|nr:hypothetical protein [Stenotrophomonas sp. ESTM1D_MKCIP4_1]AWH52249.1 hypothetical protein C1924_03105 [Stenotrophomonas sp. ESTM1D_MKCIP4_1]